MLRGGLEVGSELALLQMWAPGHQPKLQLLWMSIPLKCGRAVDLLNARISRQIAQRQRGQNAMTDNIEQHSSCVPREDFDRLASDMERGKALLQDMLNLLPVDHPAAQLAYRRTGRWLAGIKQSGSDTGAARRGTVLTDSVRARRAPVAARSRCTTT